MTDILVFGAHPDDAEFGMGGTIIDFLENGKDVAVCVLTRGECGSYGTPEERESEMKDAAKKFGFSLDILDLKDCNVFDNYENRVKLAKMIRKHKPRLIFAPYHTNNCGHTDAIGHPDHTATGLIVRSAARYAKFRGFKEIEGDAWKADSILYYMIPRNCNPAVVNDITGHIDKFKKLASCHKSQMKLREGNVLDSLVGYRLAWGNSVGVEYGEAFLSDEPVRFDPKIL